MAPNRKNKPKIQNSEDNKVTLIDSIGKDLGSKLKKMAEDNLKEKIRKAQSDPKVQEASKKYSK